MTDEEFLRKLIADGCKSADAYFAYAHVVAFALEKKLHEQLRQLVNGPIWDGDVICKSHRDALIEVGLAMRCCFHGEQGYTAASYFAYSVSKIIEDRKT